MIDRESAIVANLIYKELDNYSCTEESLSVINDIVVEDYGNLIRVTIAADKALKSSYLYADTIKAIGNLFGDNNPAVTVENNLIQLIIMNENVKEIMVDESDE